MTLPGLEFRPRGRRAQPSPLHSDVAGFVGAARRGPIGVPIRVEGWRRFERLFGGLDPASPLSYALRAYFENGGIVAYVVRVSQGELRHAEAIWELPPLPKSSKEPLAYRVRASSPGVWGANITVQWTTHRRPSQNRDTYRLIVSAPGERTEYHVNVDPSVPPSREDLGRGLTPEHELLLESDLIELVPFWQTASSGSGRTSGTLSLRLADAERPTIRPSDYLAALDALADVPEVALLAMPGLYHDLSEADDRFSIIQAMLEQAIDLQDRLALLDPPAGSGEVMGDFMQGLAGLSDAERLSRGGAVYGPWLRVSDPYGGIARPLRDLPASGHIAGIISRLDRERGAHHTPANVSLQDAVDVAQVLRPEEGNDLYLAGFNLIRCQPGRGLMVWGGRTPDRRPEGRFVAHRRLIHRLVRAIRRVAEPLVFENNGEVLWLAFTRAITSVLLEAYRAGALKGDRPEDGFRVQCDQDTNPRADQEAGRVTCLVSVAPAVPLEFITLRVALSETKQVEVFDT